MIFYAQKELQTTPEKQALADALTKHFNHMDHPSPAAMMQVMKDDIATHWPGLTVGQLNATLTIMDRDGILLRIRTAS